MLKWVRQLFVAAEAPPNGPGVPAPNGEHAALAKAQLVQGNFTAAIDLYRAAIAAQPGDALQHLNLGFALKEAGLPNEAQADLQQALRINPDLADAHYLLGTLAAEQGDQTAAMSHWRRALALAPGFEIAWINLCHLLLARGETDAAAVSLEQGLVQLPRSPDLHFARANLYSAQQQFAAAIEHYEKAFSFAPGHVDALYNKGVALYSLQRYQEARAAYRQILGIRPDHFDAHVALGNIFYVSGEREEAVNSYRNASRIHPGDAGVLRNLGTSLYDLARFSEAEDAYRAAVAASPDGIEVRIDLLNALYAQGHFDQAIAAADDAIALAPQHPGAHFGRAQSLLARGDLLPGWGEYESRWEYLGYVKPPFSQPEWDGKSALQGKVVLLFAEQGYGDTVQFIRYAELLAQRGARILVLAPAPLQTLLGTAPGVGAVFTSPEAVPPFDLQCALMSLPLLFGTELGSIPAHGPYLHGAEAKRSFWHERLGPGDGRLRVGLAWAGNPVNSADRLRSMHFSQWLDLLDIPGVAFFSLQLGEPAIQLNDSRAATRVFDYTAELRDFDDTAALMSQLDLVISVDTAIAHLAGAIGKPVWILNRYNGCWRWLAGRDDSPWYPTARLFRQARFGDWDGVMADVVKALAAQLESAVSNRIE